MSTIEKAVGKLYLDDKSEEVNKLPVEVDEGCIVSGHVDLDVSDSAVKENIVAKNPEPTVSSEQEYIVDIPMGQFALDGMVTLSAPRSQIAEEYRIIKRPLLTNIFGKTAADIEHPNLIVVTSCFQGEGKTFTAINLAMSMSMERDKTVLFVDGDIAKASAGTLLGVPEDAPGLIDVLVHDDISIEDVMLHTSIPNLRIIPAGRIHERATEMLASEKMHALNRELSERYPDRVVVFDSPPLLLTTESRILANTMGQIVFVVAAEQTSNDALTEAIGYLSEDKAIGMVLNKAKRNLWDDHRYGYGYGYGYGESGRAEHGGEGLD